MLFWLPLGDTHSGGISAVCMPARFLLISLRTRESQGLRSKERLPRTNPLQFLKQFCLKIPQKASFSPLGEISYWGENWEVMFAGLLGLVIDQFRRSGFKRCLNKVQACIPSPARGLVDMGHLLTHPPSQHSKSQSCQQVYRRVQRFDENQERGKLLIYTHTLYVFVHMCAYVQTHAVYMLTSLIEPTSQAQRSVPPSCHLPETLQ